MESAEALGDIFNGALLEPKLEATTRVNSRGVFVLRNLSYDRHNELGISSTDT